MGKYIPFMSDEKLLSAIETLYSVYHRSMTEKTWKDVNKNVLDPFKFQFDSMFLYGDDVKTTLNNEILRQNDKTISNAIGAFHQALAGSINGFVETPDLTCDIKKEDNTIFAEVKNKHNTMNSRSQEAVFTSLKSMAVAFPTATCYLIEIVSKKSQNEVWEPTINLTKQSHPRIRKVSIDKFYEVATGDSLAFKKLCDVLPEAVRDFLTTNSKSSSLQSSEGSKAYNELEVLASNEERSMIDSIFKTSFGSYLGFEEK